MEVIDTHTHTYYSGHGEGTPAEVVAAAAAKSVTTLAVTEHMPVPLELSPGGHFSMRFAEVPQYISEVKAARDDHPELEVICGVEVDWLDGREDFILEQLGMATAASPAPPASARYELVLGSVHMFTGPAPDEYWPFDYALHIDGWYERGPQQVWQEYLRLWLDAVASKAHFDIMSHPDLPKKLGFFPDFDAQPLWDQMAEAAAVAARDHGLLIELNTAGLFMPCAEVYPGPALLATFRRAGVGCTISSDAHSPANVARAFAVARQAMLAAGYKEATIPTKDGDRRRVPLV
ncbi:MAG: histidinol-phosphatase HisJ family protein [Actinomycetia bacterium]|nr:histidinol-phosphatase HisJ family protein [Actinomycetes bacterium]